MSATVATPTMSSLAAPTAPRATRPWRVPDGFDPVPRPPPAALPTPPPALTEADLEAAREAGRREARESEAAETARRGAAALQIVAATLVREAEAAAALADSAADALARVVVGALGSAFPTLEARLGAEEIRRFADAILPGLAREPQVAIAVGPDGHAAVREAWGGLPHVTVGLDPELGPADVRIAWQDGRATRDATAIRTSVLDAIARIVEPEPAA